MSERLADRACAPCRRGVPPLSLEAAELIRAAVPGWTLSADGKRLLRGFAFRDYAGAFALVSAVSAVAEAERHHPDVRFGWGYAEFSLTTHAIGGLHDNDFVLAAKIDRIADGGAQPRS